MEKLVIFQRPNNSWRWSLVIEDQEVAYVDGFDVEDTIDIIDVFCHQPWRRKGKALRLFDYLKNKNKVITLEVSEINAPARRLYQKLGFTESSRRSQYYKDGSTAILMSWLPRVT